MSTTSTQSVSCVKTDPGALRSVRKNVRPSVPYKN